MAAGVSELPGLSVGGCVMETLIVLALLWLPLVLALAYGRRNRDGN